MVKYKNANEFLIDYLNRRTDEDRPLSKHLEIAFEAGRNSNLVEAPVLKKIAGLTQEAKKPLLDVVNKTRTEMFDIELAMDAFVSINKKLKEILDLTKQ